MSDLTPRPPGTAVDPPRGSGRLGSGPALGASKAPSRCSSVLLPDPEAPTIATDSPRRTCSVTSFSTGTATSPIP